MAQWHYIRSGSVRDETVGPIETGTLAERIRQGDITPETMLRSPEKTGGRWVPMRSFPPLVAIHREGEQARQEARERERAAKQEARRLAREERALAKRDEAQRKLRQRKQLIEARDRHERESLPGAATLEQPAAPPAPAVGAAPIYQQAPQPGASIVNVTVNSPQARQSNAGAVLLSFLFLGLGQVSQGRLGAALLWWALSAANLAACLTLVWIPFALLVGPLLWVLCIIDAGMYRG